MFLLFNMRVEQPEEVAHACSHGPGEAGGQENRGNFEAGLLFIAGSRPASTT